jgi:Ca-activated chloride channel homolog
VCIIPVLDVSGSMQGPKLEYVKQSMLKLIDHLKPGDYCALCTFSTEVYALQAPVELAQGTKDRLLHQLGELQTISSTNLSGGLLQGLQWAAATDLPAALPVRVILLTDGQANHGIATRRAELLPLVTQNLGRATLSCFGYGDDADQELLADMAKAGHGNYAYIKTPDAALAAFAKELGGLLSTYCQNLVVNVAPQNGHTITEVLSDVDVTEQGQQVAIKIPDVLGEETRHLVLALQLSAQKQPLPRAMSVVDLQIDYDVLDGGKLVHRHEELKPKLKFVKPGEEQTAPTPAVDQLVGAAQMVKAQLAAEAQAHAGDWHGAALTMTSCSNDLQGRGLHGLAVNASVLRGHMASAQAFAGSTGYRKSAQAVYTSAKRASSADADVLRTYAASGLEECALNALQDQLVQDFVGGSISVPGVVLPAVAAPASAPAKPQSKPQSKPKAKAKAGLSKKRSPRW